MRTDKPIILTAGPSDAALLSKLAEKTFRDAFALLNKRNDFENYVAESFTEDKIKSELFDKKNIFFMATLNNRLIGYAKLGKNPPPECIKQLPAIELSRLYSLKEYWGCGIGSALMEACIQHARSEAFQSIWLGSWKKNNRGNAFYAKMQFKIVGSKTFALGSDIQEDHIYAKLLV